MFLSIYVSLLGLPTALRFWKEYLLGLGFFFPIVIHRLEANNCKCKYRQRKRRISQTILLLYTNIMPTPTCDAFPRIRIISTTDGLPQVTGYIICLNTEIKWQVMCIHCYQTGLLCSRRQHQLWSPFRVSSVNLHSEVSLWADFIMPLASLSNSAHGPKIIAHQVNDSRQKETPSVTYSLQLSVSSVSLCSLRLFTNTTCCIGHVCKY